MGRLGLCLPAMTNKPTSHTPIRVLFCTAPSVYSDVVLQELLRSSSVELVGIVASTRILSKKRWLWWDAVRLVRKTGLRYATYLWFVTTLYSLLRHLMADTASNWKLRVPVHATRDINSSTSLSFIKSLQPDLLLSAHFNQLIGVELLELPSQGCLNIHPGKLPEYKGVDPVIRALDRGETRVGVTLHRQDQGVDTGNILATAECAVTVSDTLFSLNLGLFRSGAQLLLDKLANGGTLPLGESQQPDPRYDSWPDADVVDRLRTSDRKLLDLQEWWGCLRGRL